MSTTAATWRDYADQLTDDQLAWIANFEEQYPATLDAGPGRDDVLLHYARDHAARNKIDTEQFGHIDEPAAARRLGHWEDDGTGRWSRQFDGTEWVIRFPGASQGSDRADVDIAGTQYAEDDGTCVRHIYVNADSCYFTADQARQLSTALLNAASELDGLGTG